MLEEPSLEIQPGETPEAPERLAAGFSGPGRHPSMLSLALRIQQLPEFGILSALRSSTTTLLLRSSTLLLRNNHYASKKETTTKDSEGSQDEKRQACEKKVQGNDRRCHVLSRFARMPGK